MQVRHRHKKLFFAEAPGFQIFSHVFVHESREFRLQRLAVGAGPQPQVGGEHIIRRQVGRVFQKIAETACVERHEKTPVKVRRRVGLAKHARHLKVEVALEPDGAAIAVRAVISISGNSRCSTAPKGAGVFKVGRSSPSPLCNLIKVVSTRYKSLARS